MWVPIIPGDLKRGWVQWALCHCLLWGPPAPASWLPGGSQLFEGHKIIFPTWAWWWGLTGPSRCPHLPGAALGSPGHGKKAGGHSWMHSVRKNWGLHDSTVGGPGKKQVPALEEPCEPTMRQGRPHPIMVEEPAAQRACSAPLLPWGARPGRGRFWPVHLLISPSAL